MDINIMAVTKEFDKKQLRWIKPGKMDEEELLRGIAEAEKGPFNSIQQSKENFEQWLKNREKK
jgi:hypothetical protein